MEDKGHGTRPDVSGTHAGVGGGQQPHSWKDGMPPGAATLRPTSLITRHVRSTKETDARGKERESSKNVKYGQDLS